MAKQKQKKIKLEKQDKQPSLIFPVPVDEEYSLPETRRINFPQNLIDASSSIGAYHYHDPNWGTTSMQQINSPNYIIPLEVQLQPNIFEENEPLEGIQNKDKVKITSKYQRPEPYTLSERNEAIERWRMKRERRNASSDNRYKGRQDYANSRKRFKGRFIPKGGKIKKRKWSLKYKRSINCKKPKGFSQKQYCKRVNKKHLTRRKK